MKNILNFIGTGGAFSKENINNSAYYLLGNRLILFDCGETVFNEILKKNIINEKIKKIDIILTHFHSDHVGSLGSLVFFCRFRKLEEVRIIFPIKEDVYTLLNLFGIDKTLYKVITPNSITEYFLKEYEQIHGDVDKEGNIIKMPSYGYHFISEEDNLFYSGDTNTICDIILEKFKNKEIKYLYQEVTNDNYKSHTSIKYLEQKIPQNDRKRVFCMHLSDNFDIDKLKKLGFNSVR